jgi:hypothetical protein
MEILKNRWKDIIQFPYNESVIKKMNSIFGSLLEIQSIFYDDVGYMIFKIVLRANKKGVIYEKDELGIKIKIKEENDFIKNEVKKNNLIYEKRNVLELRIKDQLIFYLSHAKY